MRGLTFTTELAPILFLETLLGGVASIAGLDCLLYCPHFEVVNGQLDNFVAKTGLLCLVGRHGIVALSLKPQEIT